MVNIKYFCSALVFMLNLMLFVFTSCLILFAFDNEHVFFCILNSNFLDLKWDSHAIVFFILV